MWESLARCCFLVARASGARDRRFKSDHPDCYETYSGVAKLVRHLPVKETSEGSNPSAGALLCGRASRLATALRSKRSERKCLASSTLAPSALCLMICAIGRAAKVLDFQSGQVGSTPTWHSVSSSNLQVWANGKPAAFEAVHWRFESFRLCLWDRHLACQCSSRMTSWKLIPHTNQYSGVATVGRCVWL